MGGKPDDHRGSAGRDGQRSQDADVLSLFIAIYQHFELTDLPLPAAADDEGAGDSKLAPRRDLGPAESRNPKGTTGTAPTAGDEHEDDSATLPSHLCPAAKPLPRSAAEGGGSSPFT